jgi:hypothetical protein
MMHQSDRRLVMATKLPAAYVNLVVLPSASVSVSFDICPPHIPDLKKWRARQDSNLRPLAPEANALSS